MCGLIWSPRGCKYSKTLLCFSPRADFRQLKQTFRLQGVSFLLKEYISTPPISFAHIFKLPLRHGENSHVEFAFICKDTKIIYPSGKLSLHPFLLCFVPLQIVLIVITMARSAPKLFSILLTMFEKNRVLPQGRIAIVSIQGDFTFCATTEFLGFVD